MISEFAGTVHTTAFEEYRTGIPVKCALDHKIHHVLSPNNGAGRPDVIFAQESRDDYNVLTHREEPLLIAGSAYITDIDDSELRQRLCDRTDGDLLAIGEAYRMWGGEHFLSHVYGEFGFALWDGSTSHLYLGRDRVGLRGIYFTSNPEVFAFASSSARLARYKAAGQPSFNASTLEMFLAFGNTGAFVDSTFFRGIKKVLPGHVLIVSKSGQRQKRYWFPEQTRLITYARRARYSERVQELLSAAVTNRVRGKGLLWCDLSGGLDSTCMLSVLSRLKQMRQVEVVCRSLIDSSNPESSERPYMECAQKAFGVRAVVHDPALTGNLVDLLCPSAPEIDEPSLSCLAYPEIARLASEMRQSGSTVHFSGRGGDHVFTPPNLLYLMDLAVRNQKVFRSDLRYWSSAPGETAADVLYRQVLLPLVADCEWRFRYPPPPWMCKTFRAWAMYYGVSSGSSRLTQFEERHVQDHLVHICRGAAHAQQAAALLCKCGIESHQPYFDGRLVEFIIRIPPRELCNPGLPKSLLREAFGESIPEAIRQKWRQPGGGMIFASKLRRVQDDLERMLRGSVLADLHIIDPSIAVVHLRRLLQGELQLINGLALLVSAELWTRTMVK